MNAPKFGIGSGGANPNSSKTIDASNSLAQDLIAASYFDRGVVGDDIYRDLTGNNIRCLPVAQLQSYLAATPNSGDTLSHQGYTTDGTDHYTFDTGKIWKYPDDASWTTTPVSTDSNSSPFTSLESGSAHIGDGQYYSSQLVVPVTNGTTSAPFLSQIAIYDVSAGLPYNHHVVIDDGDGATFGCAGIAYNVDTDELYVVDFYGNYSTVFVYDLSDIKAAAAGSTVSPTRAITLNFPAYQAQGIFYKEGKLHIALNEGDIFIYDLSGRFIKSYFINGSELGGSGGNQGLDFSQAELRLVMSSAASQGVVYYFDVSSLPIKSATDTNGERLEHANSLRLVFNPAYMAKSWPDTGTILLRLKVRSASTRLFMDTRVNSVDWQTRSYDSGFPVKIDGYLNTKVIPNIDNVVVQDTWFDFAFTWDRFGGVVSDAQATIVVDGTQSVGADDPWGSTPLDIGLGVISRFQGAITDGNQPDHDVLYRYMCDTVKTLAEINAIHTAIQTDGMIK